MMRRIHVSDGEHAHGAGIVGSKLVFPLLVLLLFASGCGFNDQLTRRGFISSGDFICSQTIIKAYVDSQQAASRGRPLPRMEVIRSQADGYGAAARRIRALSVSSHDTAMRDLMATAFGATAGKLELASRAGGDAQATRAAISAVAELAPTFRAIRAYGFEKCAAQLRPS
jgi:hypothetical protein